MKYYLYIAPSKIQMLYEQLPVKLREKLSSELSIDLKLIAGAIKKTADKETLISKLNAVLDSLDEQSLGTVSSPGLFFHGTMYMRWAPIHFTGHGQDETNRPQLVLFAGSISGAPEQQRMLGLVGSLAHVIGSGIPEPAAWYYTNPSVVAEIAEALREPSADEYEDSMYGVYPAVRSLAEGIGHVPDVPLQKLEFVAKRFLTTEDVLLGSPLYVALVE